MVTVTGQNSFRTVLYSKNKVFYCNVWLIEHLQEKIKRHKRKIKKITLTRLSPNCFLHFYFFVKYFNLISH
jgi:hypothetical protein